MGAFCATTSTADTVHGERLKRFDKRLRGGTPCAITSLTFYMKRDPIEISSTGRIFLSACCQIFLTRSALNDISSPT